MSLSTTVDPKVGLIVPVIDLALDKTGQKVTEPENMRNSLLELLFSPEQLESLVIVKLDKNNKDRDPLAQVQFNDGKKRELAFSSGQNVYYAAPELAKSIQQFFATQLDHACRYGSLLTSSCLEDVARLDSSNDGKPLRIKIVDSQSKNPAEIQAAQKWKTGDCHGKISPRLAKMLGGKDDRSFQFRLAYSKQWSVDPKNHPQTSFLAKGTFLPDAELTDKQGYDLILDRSSIKGIAKDQINQLIPGRDYEIPQAVIGNRANAKNQKYDNSWQFLVWFNQEAIAKDIAPVTKKEASLLAAIQKDPLKLRDYIISLHTERSQQQTIGDDTDINSSPIESTETPAAEQKSESRWISLLRSDKYAQLISHPKIVDFMQTQLAKRWKDLAIKGAVRHDSAMAQPCDDLKKGTIVAPHLKDGTEVIITRYPIVSKDNIRRYRVDNQQKPELKKYSGCVFIRPDQAMEHHQCDFDGDQLIVTPAKSMPNIAQEVRYANEQAEFKKVEKKEKIDYNLATDKKGNKLYTSLRQIAAAIPLNSIGTFATFIGKVQSHVPGLGENAKEFQHRKTQLLNQLYDALQIEVDSPKSARRWFWSHPNLFKEAKQWCAEHTSYLFQFRNNEKLYRNFPLPTEGGNAINVIAKDAVNPHWQEAKLTSISRHEFRYLFDAPEGAYQEIWSKNYQPLAKQIVATFRKRAGEIYRQNPDNPDARAEQFGQLYNNFRNLVDTYLTTEISQKLGASALHHAETTRPNDNSKKCKELSKKLLVTFQKIEDYSRRSEALPKDTYLLDVPYNQAQKAYDQLKQMNLKFEATLHQELPMVRMALLDPSDQVIAKYQEKFGSNQNNHLQQSDVIYYENGYQKNILNNLTPPPELTWLEDLEEKKPKSPLAMQLFTDQFCAQLNNYQLDLIQLTGQKHNDFKDTDFSHPEWTSRQVECHISSCISENHRYQGRPIVSVTDPETGENRQLAMFTESSPKLPIGATFSAIIQPGSGSSLELAVTPNSIKIPMTDLPKDNQAKDEGGRMTDEVISDNVPSESQSNSVNPQTINIQVAEKYQYLMEQPEPNTKPIIKPKTNSSQATNSDQTIDIQVPEKYQYLMEQPEPNNKPIIKNNSAQTSNIQLPDKYQHLLEQPEPTSQPTNNSSQTMNIQLPDKYQHLLEVTDDNDSRKPIKIPIGFERNSRLQPDDTNDKTRMKHPIKIPIGFERNSPIQPDATNDKTRMKHPIKIKLSEKHQKIVQELIKRRQSSSELD